MTRAVRWCVPWRAALLGATALLPAQALAQSWAPLNYGNGNSVTVPFLNGPSSANFFLNQSTPTINSPTLSLTFPSITSTTPFAFTMDTGSTGIVVSQQRLGLTDAQVSVYTANAPAGSVTYSSSGVLVQGSWVRTQVNLMMGAGNAATAAVADVPILLATQASCTGAARNCTAQTTAAQLQNLAMVGVGFGRNADGQPQAMPRVNPLLNITQINVGGSLVSVGSAAAGGTNVTWGNSSAVGGSTYTVSPGSNFNLGYVVGQSGVTLGLTRGNTQGGAFIQLTPNTGSGSAPAVPGDWAMARGGLTVAVPGNQPVSGLGQSLADTGVREMILVPPNATQVLVQGGSATQTQPFSQVFRQNTVLASGTNLLVDLGAAGLAGYALTTNGQTAFSSTDSQPAATITPGSSAAAPNLILNANLTGPFVNTGRNVLSAFQIVFDPLNGFIGYLPAAGTQPPAALGSQGTGVFLTPGIGIQGALSLPANFSSTIPVVLLDVTSLSTSGVANFTGPLSAASFGSTSNQPATLTLGGGGVFNFSGVGTTTAGTFVQAGTVLNLTNGNEIGSGALTLTGATLGANGSYTLANAVALAGAGGTVTPNGRTITLSGSVTGGGLTVSGPGTLILANTGNNTYSGGTVVQQGATLSVSTAGQLGTGGVTLNNGTLLTTANLSLSAPMTVTAAGGTVNVAANTTLTVTQNITGFEYLTHTGSGVFSHLGNVTASQPVAVDTTELAVQGQVSAPALTIAANGTLSGNGTISAPTTVHGTLSPGSSPGRITFTAPVTMGPGGRLRIDVDGPGIGTGPGNTDAVQLVGAGSTFTANGRIVPVLREIRGASRGDFTPALGQTFTIVQAQGGVLGSFASITQPARGLPAGTRFDALYGANTVQLVVTPRSYGDLGSAGLAQTANQAAVGAALDAFRPAAGPRPTDAVGQGFANLYQQAPVRLGLALDSLAGTPWGDALSARLEAGRGFGAAMMDQLAAARGTAASGQQALQGDNLVWLRGTGQPMLRLGGDGRAPGASASGAGVAAGFERRLNPQFRLGAAVGYASTTLNPRLGGRGESDALLFGVYGGWTGPLGLFADADLSGGWAQDRVRRNLAPVAGGTRGTADGSSFSVGLRFGAAREYGGTLVEPAIGFRYARVDRNAVAEQGATGFGLNVAGQALESARLTLGVALRRGFALGEGVVVTPSVRAAYARELADARAVTTAAFQALPGLAYTASSAAPGRDAALLGAGVAVQFRPNMSVFLDYAADLRANFTAQAISAGFRVSF